MGPDCKILLDQFCDTYKSIVVNLENIAEEESIRWPQREGNCINWVLGHILLYRMAILELLKQPTNFNEVLKCYRRGLVSKKMDR